MPTPDPLSHFASELHIAQVPPAVRTQLGWILLDTVGAAPATELLDRIEREARVLDQAVLESLLASLDEELADFIEALGNTQP